MHVLHFPATYCLSYLVSLRTLFVCQVVLAPLLHIATEYFDLAGILFCLSGTVAATALFALLFRYLGLSDVLT